MKLKLHQKMKRKAARRTRRKERLAIEREYKLLKRWLGTPGRDQEAFQEFYRLPIISLLQRVFVSYQLATKEAEWYRERGYEARLVFDHETGRYLIAGRKIA